MNYSVWVTHRDNYQDISKPNLARTNLIKYMKTLQMEMNLEFAKICQPVKLVQQIVETNTSSNQTTASVLSSLLPALGVAGNSTSVDKKDV